MSGNIPFGLAHASNVAARNGREDFNIIESGNILPPDGWFMQIVHDLWGNNENSPAKWLRSFTGFPERTCRSAASGDTDPSSAMLYVLLRGRAGDDILCGIMRDCQSQWWLDLQRHARMGAAADKAR